MINVAVTGAEGFIGKHLVNYLGLFPQDFRVKKVMKEDFKDPLNLSDSLKDCDALVHLAALNRHPEMDCLYQVNREISEKLLSALESCGTKPHIIYASSTQEGNGKAYGIIKEETRLQLADWSSRNGTPFLGLIIPNVFGPFGRAFYHSVVATFCHQLIHGESPEIIEDKLIPLIYVNKLCEIIAKALGTLKVDDRHPLKEDGQIRVSELLKILEHFDRSYRQEYRIPALDSTFMTSLFNTYRSYLPVTGFPFKLKVHKDDRGSLAEIIRTGTRGQVFYSTTKTGISRGNHFHLRKVERFCVLHGEAIIRMRRIGTKEVIHIPVSGKEPSVVDIPVWYTHNITNTGEEELTTLFWSNEFYDPEDTDTWYEEV